MASEITRREALRRVGATAALAALPAELLDGLSAVKPIIFSGPMVRALLDGRKTQTRRMLGTQPESWLKFDLLYDGKVIFRSHSGMRQDVAVPYAVGDRLWVRESWRTAPEADHLRPSEIDRGAPILTLADTGLTFPSPLWGRYRHARFMPRWASRLALTVTEVRCQRLQEISEENAEAEGLLRSELRSGLTGERIGETAFSCGDGVFGRSATKIFARLWNGLHGSGAWAANPWVFAYSFVVEQRNVDR